MRAVVLKRHGGPAVLRVSELPDPTPGPGQVAVRVKTIGLNFAEVLSRKGLYGWAPSMPYTPGMEAFGEIVALGPGAARSVGEAVIVGTKYGAYAEMMVVDQAQALPAVEGWSAEENAAFAVNYMTAWIALHKMARLRPDDTVLVQAAAGGVGTAAVQLAGRFGCTVYGTAGADEKIAMLEELGITAAVNYRTTDFEEEIRRMTGGRGVDVVVEVVGGEVFRKSVRLLAPFGRVLVVGFAGYNLKKWNPLSWYRTWRDVPKAGIVEMSERSFGIMASHLGYLLQDPDLVRAAWAELTSFVTRHGIKPVVGHVMPFTEIAEAHRLMESRNSRGKIVLRVGE
jgi:NADPH:quinone reductase-like Zn-dependent oxidoreductase